MTNCSGLIQDGLLTSAGVVSRWSPILFVNVRHNLRLGSPAPNNPIQTDWCSLKWKFPDGQGSLRGFRRCKRKQMANRIAFPGKGHATRLQDKDRRNLFTKHLIGILGFPKNTHQGLLVSFFLLHIFNSDPIWHQWWHGKYPDMGSLESKSSWDSLGPNQIHPSKLEVDETGLNCSNWIQHDQHLLPPSSSGGNNNC